MDRHFLLHLVRHLERAVDCLLAAVERLRVLFRPEALVTRTGPRCGWCRSSDVYYSERVQQIGPMSVTDGQSVVVDARTLRTLDDATDAHLSCHNCRGRSSWPSFRWV